MKIKTKFILPLSVVFITGILVIVIFSDIRESEQDINREKKVWISLGENLARSWKSTMRFTGSDNLARDQFYQKPLDFEISRQIVRNPRLTHINPESSPYASSDFEMRVIKEGKAISQIIESNSVRNLVTFTPIVAEQECVTCHRRDSQHDIKVGDVMGVIKLTSSVEHVYAQIAQDRYIMILGMTLIFLIGIIIIYYITNRLTEPITQLTESSQLLAQGNLDIQTNIERKDELGVLGNAFDAMTVNLRDSRRNLEEALRHAEESDKVKTLFLANMSHEIRTPLNAILGFTDLIKQTTQHLVGPEEQTFFETIERSGERLMHTVHEILDISQIEAGAFNLKPEPLHLEKLAEQVVHDLQPIAKHKGLELVMTSQVSKAVITADKYCVTQALTNIIDNAIKYTEKGEVDISLMGKGKRLILTIQDSGIGMSEEYQEHLFELFTQESTGYTKKFQGIGLGLALTKRYLDKNDIDIDIESTKDIGTTVRLNFKSEVQTIPTKLAKPEVSTEVVEKPMVLVVEDDLTSQNLTMFYLRDHYDICFAVSVSEAKQQLNKRSVDLILLDLSLIGDEDGLDLVRYLRKTKKWKDLPIVALTAHAFVTDQEKSLDAGCIDYIAKPVTQNVLLEKIKQIIEKV